MKTAQPFVGRSCSDCAIGKGLDFDFTMAFQPIVHFPTQSVFGHEALVRGLNNESAGSILERVTPQNRYRFDQACRVKAIQVAAGLQMQTMLSINFLPNAVYQAETCIRTTLEAARRYEFPCERIIFEVTEVEKIEDHLHLRSIFEEYKRVGFKTAIDDFGAGYAGLSLLAEFQPDIVKLDMALIRNIDKDRTRRAIVRGILGVCESLNCRVVAEGVETLGELQALRDLGVDLFQGYYFARPAFQAIPTIPPELFALRQPSCAVSV